LAAGVMAGLAKKPEDRPPTCSAVLVGEHPPQKDAEPKVESLVGRAALSAPYQTVEPSFEQVKKPSLPANKPVETVIVSKPVHNKVQLWEGGPYWAETNIGARKHEDYGFYFWWGGTVGYKREGDAWVASDGSSSEFKFDENHTQTYGKELSTLLNEGWVVEGEERKSLLGKLLGAREDGVLTTEHDAARVHWGGEWRMPTKQELNDLCNKCDWRWTQRNGVNGYAVRGRDAYVSASIFLPAAGFGYGTSLGSAGSNGYYWSSVPDSGSSYNSWDLGFGSGYHDTRNDERYYGFSVRPVQGFTK
jgi:hypothetical protein